MTTYKQEVLDHPLTQHLLAAVEQAMYGKGQRHGGAVTPFMDQPWTHYARMHGRGFLTGQAAKKLEEAASTRTGEAFSAEVRGAIVYLGMALIGESYNTVAKVQKFQEPAANPGPVPKFQEPAANPEPVPKMGASAPRA